MYQTGCRYFSGYRPCEKNPRCDESCPHRDIPDLNLLMVHLGAMGSVLRATALLPMIKHKFPKSQITWVTETPELLQNHPLIDRLLSTHEKDLLQLAPLEFDVAFVLDKSLVASGVLERAKYIGTLYGFQASALGGIEPANASAFELWELGLNNQKKLYGNQKTELQLQAEALNLHYQREGYGVYLSHEEKQLVHQRSEEWSNHGVHRVIGLNTGCGPLLPEKKINIFKWREIIVELQKSTVARQISYVLLGGPSEKAMNDQLKKEFPFMNLSPHTEGVRSGLCSVGACDMILTGDSLGMHMAIGLQKYVIAWFGPSCAHEIDLYDRGEMILSSTLSCSPCWKRQCYKIMKCHDIIEPQAFVQAVERGIEFLNLPQPLYHEKTRALDFLGAESEKSPELMSLLHQLIL